MGLYDEQIKRRMKTDADSFTRSFAELSGAVMGDAPMADLEAREKAKNAIEMILKYYGAPIPSLPNGVDSLEDQMEYMMRPSGIMRRRVQLRGKWYRDGYGALLGRRKDTDEIVALIPNRRGGYAYIDYQTGRRTRIDHAQAERISENAYCFYSTLPLRPISIRDFLLYVVRALSLYDYALMVLLMAFATAVGLLTPYITAELFGGVLAHGDRGVLLAAACVLVGAAVSIFLINTVRALISSRIKARAGIATQPAMVMRLLSMPVSFFKQFTAGELAGRIAGVEALCVQLTDGIVMTLLTSLFSLTYIAQIFRYAPQLAWPSFVVMLASALFTVFFSVAQFRVAKRQMEWEVKERGVVHSLISGVQKLRLAGAEHRAFAKWAQLYAKRAKLQYSPPKIIVLGGVIQLLITSVGMIVLYVMAARSSIAVSDYMAFSAAYGMVSSAFLALAGTALATARIGNTLGLMKPILDTAPEMTSDKTVVTNISGTIELSNVSFRYNANMPLVLDEISFKIQRGSYTAIVGATGCGKSTLMRILLGFETPQKGAIYFDGRDMASMDLKSLRRNSIGVVLQGGRLFQGDIYSNITISAPGLTEEEVWEAAEVAGIAEDIRQMPMGMHTRISEGSGGVSGGQRQRLLIARAVASKPKILLLDEATSALDNITQRHVSDALARLRCTRVVIAHRLSTIKDCDRILVLDQGKIAEDGTYDELMERDGLFADLVRRQL